MARRSNKTMELIGYILTPEFSSEYDQHSGGERNRTLYRRDWEGRLKAAVWILVSIMLSIALGQLN